MLKASLLASLIGTVSWLRGTTDQLWPSHPWLAVVFITVGATVLLRWVLPEPKER